MNARPEPSAGAPAPLEDPSSLRAALEDTLHQPVAGDGPVADVVRRALAEPVLRLIVHDPGVHAGEDPEAVHQARVATRRLRANLSTLRPLLDRGRVRELRAELKWLGRSLGAVRDLDVMLDRLSDRARALDARDARTAERLFSGIADSKAVARFELARDTRSERYRGLVQACAVLAGEAAPPGEHAAEALRPLMQAQWKCLGRACDRLTHDSPNEELHAARILAKRARYAAEAVSPAFGGGGSRFVRKAGALQAAFGEHQDAVVAEAWLRGRAAVSTPTVAFVAGELAAEESRAQAAARAAWPKAWRALSRDRLRFWS